MYICLEGIDGSGKSTQLERLGNWLENCGFSVTRIREPTDSPVGRLIREMLQTPHAQDESFQITLALLFAADRMLLMEDIQKNVELKRVVISDRSFYSSLAYQNGRDWVAQINKYALKPDLVILLDLETETAVKRCDGKDNFEQVEFLDKVRKRYLQLAKNHNFMVVNAENGLNKVHDDIKRIVAPKLGMCL
ncbi:MAG: dTMP kinase [Methanobacteriaceae archaeon]|nr:dTMP kinase [Methanobacteriaceae archaeon]